MSFKTGWIKIPREAFLEYGPGFWSDRKATTVEAFVDLQLMANIKTKEIDQSIIGLSRRWGWNRKRVRSFFEIYGGHLEGQLRDREEDIPKQPPEPNTAGEGTGQGTEKGQGKGQDNKEVLQEQELPPIVPQNMFEKFWKSYPRKTGKKKARENWERINPSPEKAQQVIDAVNAQSATIWVDQEEKYIPHPATWLHQERWNDEVAAGELQRPYRELF